MKSKRDYSFQRNIASWWLIEALCEAFIHFSAALSFCYGCLFVERHWWVHKDCWGSRYRSRYISLVALAVPLSWASPYTAEHSWFLRNHCPSVCASVGLSLFTMGICWLCREAWIPGLYHSSATISWMHALGWRHQGVQTTKAALGNIFVFIDRTTPEKKTINSMWLFSFPCIAFLLSHLRLEHFIAMMLLFTIYYLSEKFSKWALLVQIQKI